MALAVADSILTERPMVSIDWGAAQLAQFAHDETYHREITRLPLQQRLTHMALHFAKYAGRLHDSPSDDEFRRTAVDCLVIATTCANALNLDLAAGFVADTGGGLTRAHFVRQMSVAAGRMAAACEKLDHLEDFPFRATLASETQNILSACVDLFGAEGWSPDAEIAERLRPIKAKAFFHGKA